MDGNKYPVLKHYLLIKTDKSNKNKYPLDNQFI